MCLSKPRFLDLPQEIRSNIVEQLDRRRDLVACCFAHRSLTWSAQRMLHRAVRFDWTPGSKGPVIKNRDVYADPQIAGFVHKLSLSGLPAPKESRVTWAVLARLTNVKELILTMRNFDMDNWPCITPEDRDTFLKTFPNVETLKIDCDYFCHVEDFLFFLSAFPNVTTLSLHDVNFCACMSLSGEVFPKQTLEGIPCSRLRHLDFCTTFDRPEDPKFEPLMQQWILPLSRVVEPGFTLKWFEDITEVDSIVFSLFLQAFAPMLGSLEVTLDSESEISSAAVSGIQHADKLESLALISLCRPNRDESNATPDRDTWVLDVLSQITSTRIRTITLDFASSSVDDLLALDLGRVYDTLVQPHLANARVVIILPDSWQMADKTNSPAIFMALMAPFMELFMSGRLEVGRKYADKKLEIGSMLALVNGAMG